MHGLQGVAVGPDQLAIGLKPRQFAGTRPGGQNDVLCRQFFGAFVGFDADLAFGRNARLTHKDGDFVLFHQMTDAARQLTGNFARPFHHRVQIIVDAIRLKAEFLGTLHQMEHFGGPQHRLGRDTSPIQTDTAQVFAFDDGNFHAQLRATDGCNIAPRTSPDDNKIKGLCSHDGNLAGRCYKYSLPLNYIPQGYNLSKQGVGCSYAAACKVRSVLPYPPPSR